MKITKTCEIRYVLFRRNKSFYRDFLPIVPTVVLELWNPLLGAVYSTMIQANVVPKMVSVQPILLVVAIGMELISNN
jgi:hypothetical protein